MQSLAPVQTKEREIFIDVLRGFAILGIFIANLNGFSWYSEQAKATGPYLLPAADHTMSFCIICSLKENSIPFSACSSAGASPCK